MIRWFFRSPHRVQRVIAQTEEGHAGGSVLLEATVVHAHSCPAWRIGQRHGPCDCGAVELWQRYEAQLVEIVHRGLRVADPDDPQAGHHRACCGACDECFRVCGGYHGPERRVKSDPLVPQWEERRGRI